MSVRLRDATPEQRAACACDVCHEPIQQRGWLNPDRATTIREETGSYVHGRCLASERGAS